MSVLNMMNDVFCEVFYDDDIVITPEMTADDVDGWDSLSHINLILTIESRFGITFNQKELLSFNNVGDLVQCIEKKMAN